MRAVNLIPAEDRRGAGGVAGRSGGAVYGVLGLLALLVLCFSALAVTSHSVSTKRAAAEQAETDATAAESRAASLANYTSFSGVRSSRVSTISALAASRFDWSGAMHELARVVPHEVWLTSMVGTVSPSIQVDGATAGDTTTLRAASSGPAVQLLGCTTDQGGVATMLARMRQMDGVTRVSLASSTKADASSGGGTGGDCRQGSTHFPQFSIVVFYASPWASLNPGSPAGGSSPGAPTASTASSTTTTPPAQPAAASSASDPSAPK